MIRSSDVAISSTCKFLVVLLPKINPVVFALTGGAVFPFYDVAEKHRYLSCFHWFKVNGHKIRLFSFLAVCNFFSTFGGY